MLGEALSRDFKDLKVDLEACSFRDTPPASSLALEGASVVCGLGTMCPLDMTLVSWATCALPRLSRLLDESVHPLHFPVLYRETGQDAATGRPLPSPRAPTDRIQTFRCCWGPGARASPCRAQVPANVCEARRSDHGPTVAPTAARWQKSCPAHSDSKCTQPACLRDPCGGRPSYYCDGSAWLVFDYAAGFVVDSVPLSLDETEVSASAG